MRREHPLRILRYSIRNIWLLLFPLIRSIPHLQFTPDAFLRWLHGAWFDLCILLCILLIGWLRWRFRLYSVDSDGIRIREGILLRSETYLPISAISVLTIRTPLWCRVFRAVYVYTDTTASPHRGIRLLLLREDAENFRRMQQHDERRELYVRTWRIVLFSAIFASSLSGAVYAAAFWFQGGRLSREILAELRLPEQIGFISEEAARNLSGVPPIGVMLAIIVLSMWLLSLTANLLRYGKFVMAEDAEQIHVDCGILTKRSVCIRRQEVNCIDIRQNLLTRLCGIHSVGVGCSGYGTHGIIPVCLPLLTKSELRTTLPMLAKESELPENQLKSPLSAWWGFVWMPVVTLAAVLLTAYILEERFPAAAELVGFLRIMFLLPILWKLCIRIAALLTDGIAIADGRICLRCCKGVIFHTILADTGRIVEVKILRYPWQRWFGKCNVMLRFRGNGRQRFWLRNLAYADVQKMSDILLTGDSFLNR